MKNKNTKKSETYKKIVIGAAIVVVIAVIILPVSYKHLKLPTT